MREGSLEAPIRHPLDWRNPDFTDPAKLDAEMRRVFEACHGCRLCFNLCDSFPRLFDLVDAAGDAELSGVASADFKQVVDACTLCDLCFMTKCPYVPPHEWAIDFPHLMLRARAAEAKHKGIGRWDKALAETDRNGRLGCAFAGIANFATSTANKPARAAMEAIAGIHREAALPKFNVETLAKRARYDVPPVNAAAPGFGRKAVLYATCFGNYNAPEIGVSLRRVLAHNGVETELVYPGCCGMPQLEQGDIARVAESAGTVARALRPWIDKGYAVIALVPSCALMLKFEWPLIVPDDADVKALSAATQDAAQYVVGLAKKEGLAPGLGALDGGVTLHIACHARAQNIGHKAAELLRLIPGIDLKVIERCSGHGGSWGVKKENFPVALKVGKPVARDASRAGKAYVASECPLAGLHILQGMERIEGAPSPPDTAPHPIELFAKAYGLA
jgi:glycerol-3-phosphate dehydrogenase subunit C